jgi:hypothetical protein
MSELLKINVNDHIEKKGNLSYLSWAWAWAEVLKIDPAAVWTVYETSGLPMIYLKDDTAMVRVGVTISGNHKSCWLPVMDNRNRAIQNPDAFAINTAIMRCLAKAIAMHGLGLYIYAGEDLPEGEKPEPNPDVLADIAACQTKEALLTLFKELPVNERQLHMEAFQARRKEFAP